MTVDSSPGAAGLQRKAGVGQGFTIVVAGFLPIMAIVALAPAVPSILGHFAGAPNATTLIPLMVTAPGLMIALFSPLAGWAADRFGRRPILLAATLVYGLLGVTPFFLDKLTPVFASRLGLGVTEAVLLTVTNTLIGDYFTAEQRRGWLTVQGVAGSIFGTGVVALAGLLTAQFWNGAFLIYAVALLIFVAMVAFIYEPARHTPHAAEAASGEPFPWGRVLGFCAATLFSSIMYYVFIVQGGLAFDAIGVKSPKALGVFISIASIGVPVGALVFAFLSRRLGPLGLVAVFLSLLGLGMVGISFSPTPAIMTATAMIQQVGAGMAVPALIFWATGAISAEHRGRGMGAWSTAFFLGQFCSPLIVGAVRGLSNGRILTTFGVMGVLALVGAGVALALRRTSPAPMREAAAPSH